MRKFFAINLFLLLLGIFSEKTLAQSSKQNQKDSCECKKVFDLSGKIIGVLDSSDHSEPSFKPTNLQPGISLIKPSTEDIWFAYDVDLPCFVKECGVVILDKNKNKILRFPMNYGDDFLVVLERNVFFENGLFFVKTMKIPISKPKE